MSASLADMLPGGPGANRLRVWLESSGYARRLLLGPEGDPWAEGAAKYLSFFSQARGLLRADVAACLSNAFAFGGLNAVLALRRA